MRKRNKKGSVQDMAVIAATLLTIAIAILISFKISREINDKIQSTGPLDGMEGADRARTAMSEVNNMYPGVMDNSFVLLTIGLSVVAIILAFMVAFHPIFFVLYFIFLAIIIFVSGVFSNIYTEMSNVPALADTAEALVFTSHIMYFLPFIVGVVGFIVSIVMYKAWQNRQ